MDWNEFLLWLQIVTANYCKKEAPKQRTECYEVIHECVLDGEDFKFCMKDWESKNGK